MTALTEAARPGMSRRGFTLIEILVVVMILGIAAAMLIPSMGHTADFSTESVVRQVVADLTFAQSDAMSRQASRRVYFDEDGLGYRLLQSPFDPVDDIIYDPIGANGSNEYVVRFGPESRFPSITIEEPLFDGNPYITYDELGGPIDSDNAPSAGGSVTLKSKTESFKIEVAAFTGRVIVTDLSEN